MLNCREYGEPPYRAVVVHGGPGAPGSAAGICRGLAHKFGVLEHLQEKDSIRELLSELKVLLNRYGLQKTVLIGHSWGAWLSFLFAAANPESVGKLILVSCGPFEEMYYPLLLQARRNTVLSSEHLADILAADLPTREIVYDPDHYCILTDAHDDMIDFHEAQYEALMAEVLPMRASGELLRFAEKIRCPVVAIHGKNDPHPWDGVKTPLESRLRDFSMVLLNRCGHEPWNEYYARDNFFEILKRELRIAT